MSSRAASVPLADAAARRLVTSDGLHRTLFVEAGAGSGKTTQLVERVIALVLDTGVELDAVAAITFTDAAAAELRHRVRAALEQASAGPVDDPRSERARAALVEVDGAAISTLHAFAARLIGEHAIEAALPPRVGVLDEVSSQLAHEHRWREFVDDLHRDPDEAPTLLRATALGIALEARYTGQATFRDVADVLSNNWDRIGPVAEMPLDPIAPVDLSPLMPLITQVLALPDTCLDPDDGFCRHLVDNVIPGIRAILDAPDDVHRLRALAAATWKPSNFGRAAAWGGAVKEHKATLKAAGEVAAHVRQTAAESVLRRLLVLTAREVLAAARSRRSDGRLEYHDLLVLARDLLRNNAAARQRLHRRFTHLLLDEFQDTDPIQIELAALIAAGPSVPEEGALWSDLDIEDGRLFFVGDPKQSIYRFRRADITLFGEARDRFAGDGGPVRLVTNFRTVEPILDAVNALFATVMPEEVPGAQPAHEPLVAARAHDSGADHRPVLLGGPHPDPKVSAPTLRELEAADVAAAVADVRDHPDEWPVFDVRTGRWRPATLADVAILIPTRTSLPYLRAALDGAGLPYRLATGTLVYDTQEIRDGLAALRAIDDPTDQLSLIAALRSPLYACSDVDLASYRRAGGRWDLRSAPPDDVASDDPVRAALAHLRALWRDRWWTGPADLLERLWRERRADLLAFGDTRPAEVWRRQRFLVDQARSFEESRGGSVRDFLEWTSLQGADGARVHEPLLDETDETALRIMTIHGAKGLEFPITVLSGMTTRPAGRRQGVSVLWGDGPTPELRLSTSVATADHEPRADLEQAMDQHEKRRLLYVAATRPRDHLVVSCHHQAGSDARAETHARLVWHALGEAEHLWRRLPERPGSVLRSAAAGAVDALDAPADVDIAGRALRDEETRARWIEARAAAVAGWNEPRVIAATTLAKGAAAAPSVDAGPHHGIHGEPGDVVDHPPRDGTAIGRAVHGVLEDVDFEHPGDDGVAGSFEQLVRRHCRAEGVDDRRDDVATMARAALASEVLREAAHLPHHREAYVATTVGRRVVEGFVDLVVERPDGLVVVDYKSDAIDASDVTTVDAAVARYRLQGAVYALALETVTGRRVAECRFLFCGTTPAIERTIDDLDDAVEEVRALLA